MSYELIKRNGNIKGNNFIENTHTSIIDSDIEKIFCYKAKDNLLILISINIISFGLINLSYFISYDFFINFYFCLCDIQHPRSKYILIKNKKDQSILVELKKSDFHRPFHKIAEKNSRIMIINENLYDDFDKEADKKNLELPKKDLYKKNTLNNNVPKKGRKTLTRYSKIFNLKDNLKYTFTYRNNNYEYDEYLHKFKASYFCLSNLTNVDIHDKFGDGLKNLTDYNYALNKFGLNEIITLKTGYFQFFFKQIAHPFYVYQIFTFIAWTINDYYSFMIIVIVLIVIVIVKNAYLSYINWTHIFSIEEKNYCLAIRNISEYDLKMGIIYDSKLITLIRI